MKRSPRKVSRGVGLASQELTRTQFLRLAGVGIGASAAGGLLTSCSGFVGGGESGGGGGDGGGTLKIFATTEERKPLSAMMDAYKAQNGGLQFDVTYAETTKLNSRLRTQLTSGTAADMFRVAPGSGAPIAVKQIAPRGFLTDLSDEPWTSRMGDSMTNLCSYEGKVYGFPATLTVMPTFYNKSVFEKNGIQPPATWDELLAICDQLKQAGIAPMALGLADPAIIQMIPYALVASTVYVDQPNFAAELAAGKASFSESAGWHDALEKMMLLNERGYYTKNPLGRSFEQAMRMVASGEAAMFTFVSTAFSQMASYASADAFGSFVTPGVNDPEKIRLPASPIDVFGINAEATDPEAAKEFIRFIAEPANVSKFAELAASLPGVSTEETVVPPVLEPVISYVEEDLTVHYMNHLWPNADVQQTLFVVGQQLFSGEVSIDEALKKMDEARG